MAGHPSAGSGKLLSASFSTLLASGQARPELAEGSVRSTLAVRSSAILLDAKTTNGVLLGKNFAGSLPHEHGSAVHVEDFTRDEPGVFGT
jgi:hypothetical protein